MGIRLKSVLKLGYSHAFTATEKTIFNTVNTTDTRVKVFNIENICSWFINLFFYLYTFLLVCRTWTFLSHVWWNVHPQSSSWLQVEGKSVHTLKGLLQLSGYNKVSNDTKVLAFTPRSLTDNPPLKSSFQKHLPDRKMWWEGAGVYWPWEAVCLRGQSPSQNLNKAL